MLRYPAHSAVATLFLAGTALQLYARLLDAPQNGRKEGHEIMLRAPSDVQTTDSPAKFESTTIDYVQRRHPSHQRRVFALAVACVCVRVGLIHFIFTNVECTGLSMAVS